QVDADAALTESNRADQRRWLQIGEPVNGLARIEGQLVAEAAASLRTAMEPFMKPRKGDERSAGPRAHDALAELARRAGRGHASRTTPPSMRRAMVARDGHCIFPGCDRPPPWCDAHHLKFWADSGPTKLENLGLVCGEHHRKVHEEGWTLERKDGRWVAKPPP